MSYRYRAYHQRLGRESIYLPDVIGLLAVLSPNMFRTVEMAGDVETRGTLTKGMTVFDQRINPEWRTNMEVAVEVDEEAAIDCVIRSVTKAGQAT